MSSLFETIVHHKSCYPGNLLSLCTETDSYSWRRTFDDCRVGIYCISLLLRLFPCIVWRLGSGGSSHRKLEGI